ncbi:hypothetical protein ACT3TY_15300 [Halomonas sp. AOP22-C1-8]|uniref:hypothetical protein n=1 Tax=Halomonas sp. AOP22-C1-8 TaxID=3457717 RepID=UPI004033C798
MATPAFISPLPLRALDIHKAPERFHHHGGTALMTLKLNDTVTRDSLQYRFFIVLEAGCAKVMSATTLAAVVLTSVRGATRGGYVFLVASLLFVPLLKALYFIVKLYLRLLLLKSAQLRFTHADFQSIELCLKTLSKKLPLLTRESWAECLQLLRNFKQLNHAPAYFSNYRVHIQQIVNPLEWATGCMAEIQACRRRSSTR